MRIQTLLHAALVVIILGLCGQVIATWRRPAPSVPVDLGAPTSLPPAAEMSPPNLTQEGTDALVATIAQNDLFSPDRGEVAAPAPVDTQKNKVDPPSHLKLVGVMLTRRRAEAFLSDSSQGNKVVRVKQGDSIGQYQLLQVTPIEVKLSLGAGGEVAPLRLQILDSATSQQAPRLVPQVTPQNLGQGRPGPNVGRGVPVPPPADPNQPAAQAPEEAQALRDNIQRMQQRLRRIRRRAAREEAATRGENAGGGGEGNDEDEDSDEE
jgi:hypothetical protein